MVQRTKNTRQVGWTAGRCDQDGSGVVYLVVVVEARSGYRRFRQDPQQTAAVRNRLGSIRREASAKAKVMAMAMARREDVGGLSLSL